MNEAPPLGRRDAVWAAVVFVVGAMRKRAHLVRAAFVVLTFAERNPGIMRVITGVDQDWPPSSSVLIHISSGAFRLVTSSA